MGSRGRDATVAHAAAAASALVCARGAPAARGDSPARGDGSGSVRGDGDGDGRSHARFTKPSAMSRPYASSAASAASKRMSGQSPCTSADARDGSDGCVQATIAADQRAVARVKATGSAAVTASAMEPICDAEAHPRAEECHSLFRVGARRW